MRRVSGPAQETVALKNAAPWGHFGGLNVVHLSGGGSGGGLCAHALLLLPLLRQTGSVWPCNSKCAQFMNSSIKAIR